MTGIPPLNVVIEAARLSAVRSYNLSAPGLKEILDVVALKLAKSYGTASALISLVDANIVRVAGQVGLSNEPMSRFGAFCHHVITEPGSLLVVRDTLFDARFHMSPLVHGTPVIRSYAGMTLIDGQGYAVGAVGILHTSPLWINGLPVEDLARASASALASLQETRSNSAFVPDAVTEHGGSQADRRSVRRSMPDVPQLWIGIRTEGSGRLALEPGTGRTVRRVAEDSPASHAGFQVGDVLLSIDGAPMRRRDDIEDKISRYRAGDVVVARVRRGWRVRLLKVRLDTTPVEGHVHVDDYEFPKNPGLMVAKTNRLRG